MILRIERNETDYWELVAYHVNGRTVLKHHGEFKFRDDGIAYAYRVMPTGIFKFCFE
jgi:hypothetical protein